MKKVILITGASSGFGFSTTKKLVSMGYIVYAVARRLEKMKELENLGAKIYKVDITNNDDIVNIVNTVITNEGKIDILINNAGYGSYGMIETYAIEDAKKQFETNLFGLARITQEVLPYLRKNENKKDTSKIINISSVVGRVSFPVLGWYSASKHALEGYSDALRRELIPFNIKVVLIEPGAIKTEFLDVAKYIKETNENYLDNTNNFIECFNKRYKNAPSSDKVVNCIVKVVNKKNPKLRYKIGSDSKYAITANKYLPTKIVDKVINKTFNIKNK